VNKFAIALLLGTVFAVGCGDKTDGAGSGSAKASSAPSGSAKAATSASAATTAAAAGALPKVCDDYWAKVKTCNEKGLAAMPEAAREATKKSYDDAEKMSKEAWAKFDAATMESTCKTSLEALEKSCPK